MFKQITFEDNKVRIWFDHAKGLSSKGNTLLKGFVIEGADKKYFPATAIIEGQTVLLFNEVIRKPVFVRYAFKEVE